MNALKSLKHVLIRANIFIFISLFITILTFFPSAPVNAQSIYYTGSTITNFTAGNTGLKSYNSGQTASIQMQVHVNQVIPNDINTNGVKDAFGISLARVMETGGKAITDTNLNSITDATLRTNRSAGNDKQTAYSSTDTPVNINSPWDAYQCGEQWIKDKDYKVGGNYVITCTVPLKQCGIYQVDINTYYNYANLPKQYQAPDQGHAGALIGYFFKVACTKTTPTPTKAPTPTPTVPPISLSCAAITFKNADTNTALANGSNITTTNNQPNNLTAQITGTSNISPVSIDWTVTGTDTNTNKVVDESSQKPTTINTTSEKYTGSYNFKFGPFDDNKSFGANDIAAKHTFVYTIIPSISYLKNNQEVRIQTSPACNGSLTTASTGQVLGNQTKANVSISKTLLTQEPITVGQTAQFKIVITNNGTEPLVNLNVHDSFGNDGIMDFQSATGVETLSNTTTAQQTIPFVATSGTTNTIDLTSISGFKALQPNDSVTLTLTFLGESQGNSCDVAIVNATGKSGTNPTATDQACALFSPAPSSPNTGADTSITLAALATLLGAIVIKKQFLKLFSL